MRFNSVKGSDFSSSARAVNKNSDAAFDASRKSSFDFTGVSIAAQQGRSQMRQAADSAQGTKDIASIRKQASKDVAKVIKKGADKAADIKRPAQRMAGIVGGLGMLSQGAMLYKGIKDDKAADAKREARYDQQEQNMQALITAQQTRAPYVPGTAPVTPAPTLIPIPSGTSTSSPPSSSSGSQPVSSASGQMFTQPQMKQLLLDQGMDDHNATIGAAVGMGESSGRSKVLNGNNEHSLGLWQHNRDTGEDRHAFYGIKDWSELEDPVTNARATYRLWERAGGNWGDWGAYTNGSYKKFLNN